MFRFSLSRSLASQICLFGSCLLFSLNVYAQRGNDESIVVEPADGSELSQELTRTALEDSLRRFADRFYTTVTQATNQIRNAENQDARTRLLMHQWKTVSAQTIVELAIGQDAVTSLLDMMVLTRISREMIDNYWAEAALTPEEGRALSDAYAVLETDIWGIGGELLIEDQVATLRSLIDDWYRDNPDQIYPWYIKLDAFSDQRALALQQLDRRGSLLGIRETRESIEEIQAFGERLLFYVQRAPTLTSYELEASVYEVLAAEEVSSLIRNADEFSASVQEMVQMVADIPGERLAAIDQLTEQLSAEREALMADLRNTSPEAEGALEEVRLALEAFERVLLVMGVDKVRAENPDQRPFDIREYHALAIEAGDVASNLIELTSNIESLVSAPAWDQRNAQIEGLLDRVEVIEERLIDKLFLYSVLLIGLFFVLLVAYRLLVIKVFRVGAA